MSSPSNPMSDALPQAVSEVQANGIPSSAPVPLPEENPPWSGWEVLALAVISFVTIVVCVLATSYAAHSYLSPKQPWTEVVKRPEVIVSGQLLAYILILIVMYKMVDRTRPGHALETIRWNWPRNWTSYLLAGMGLEISLLPFLYILPMPHNLPIDEFFKTAHDAYVLSAFGVLVAPLFEELFFRGFLYPVLARRLGVGLSTVLTALAFAGIHTSQLKYSWGPVLIIFLVGLALTAVRAVKKSVACTVLMHMAYNGTIFVVTYISTDGFRHMERLNR